MEGTTQQDELDIWKQWKKTGDPQLASNLLVSMEPLIQANLAPWKGRLPESAINARGIVLARKALDTYNPDKGTKLSTHVVNQLMPVSRLIYKYTNVAKIPEERIRMVRSYQDSVQELQDELNRRPSDAELADRMGIGVKKVGLLRREAWRDVVDSGVVSSMHAHVETSKAGEALDFVYYDLGQRERPVFEYLSGFNGKQQISSPYEIAAKTGIPVSEVMKIKKKIQKSLGEAVQP